MRSSCFVLYRRTVQPRRQRSLRLTVVLYGKYIYAEHLNYPETTNMDIAIIYPEYLRPLQLK